MALGLETVRMSRLCRGHEAAPSKPCSCSIDGYVRGASRALLSTQEVRPSDKRLQPYLFILMPGSSGPPSKQLRFRPVARPQSVVAFCSGRAETAGKLPTANVHTR